MSARVRAVDPDCLARWCGASRQHASGCDLQIRVPFRCHRAPAGRRSGGRDQGASGLAADGGLRRGPPPNVPGRLFVPRAAHRRDLLGADVATAETYVPGGAALPSTDHARAFAEAFARLIRLAPRPTEVPTLEPAPSWAAWNHVGEGLWPHPEEPDVNLNEVAGPEWIDDAGRRAGDRLRAGEPEAVIGHSDWLAGNLRWNGDELLVVHDWDSTDRGQRSRSRRLRCRAVSGSRRGRPATIEDLSDSSSLIAIRVVGSSAPTSSSGRGRLACGPGRATPSLARGR